MGCHYCGYHEGGHNVACPESMSGDAKVQAYNVWQEGYRTGRSGKKKSTNASATYSLGYLEGEVALEAYENGHDPRFDDVSADSAYYDSDDCDC